MHTAPALWCSPWWTQLVMAHAVTFYWQDSARTSKRTRISFNDHPLMVIWHSLVHPPPKGPLSVFLDSSMWFLWWSVWQHSSHATFRAASHCAVPWCKLSEFSADGLRFIFQRLICHPWTAYFWFEFFLSEQTTFTVRIEGNQCTCIYHIAHPAPFSMCLKSFHLLFYGKDENMAEGISFHPSPSFPLWHHPWHIHKIVFLLQVGSQHGRDAACTLQALLNLISFPLRSLLWL